MRVVRAKQGAVLKKLDTLDYAYVFTNLEKIKLDDDLVKSYTTIYDSKRKNIYKLLKLPSWYRVRQRERTRLSPLFRNVFKEESEKYKLKSKIDKDKKEVKRRSIQEEHFEKPRDFKDIEGEYFNIDNEKELSFIFDQFIDRELQESPSYYPEERSQESLKLSIYSFF